MLMVLVLCAVLWHGVLQAMWGFARMEYRPPNQLLDAVLKVGKGQATNGGALRCGRVCGECEGIPGGTVCAGGVCCWQSCSVALLLSGEGVQGGELCLYVNDDVNISWFSAMHSCCLMRCLPSLLINQVS